MHIRLLYRYDGGIVTKVEEIRRRKARNDASLLYEVGRFYMGNPITRERESLYKAGHALLATLGVSSCYCLSVCRSPSRREEI